ncbi:MAG: DMT family transporter [Bacillota bacterium]|nr:DMT family transporter [Bacillota bacterium]
MINKTFILGPIQMLASALFFGVMTYFAKLVSVDISGSEVAFFRLLFGVAVVLILALTGVIDISSKNKGLLIARGVFGGSAVILFFLGLANGSLTNSTVLNNTNPIFAAMISAVILKEKITIKMTGSILIACLGIVVLFWHNINAIKCADLFSLASGFLGGFAITSVRQLRKRNESAWTIFFYFCIFGLIASLIFSITSWKWPTPTQYLLLLLTGSFGLLGQVMMTSAYKYCKAALGGVLSMSTCVFSAFLGILFLNETPTLLELVGAILILSASVLAVLFEEPSGNI